MIGWSWWQLAIYGVPNLVAAIASLYISRQIKSIKKRRNPESVSYLFELLLVTNALYYMLGPLLLCSASFIPAVAASLSLMIITVLVAIKLKV